MKHLTTSQKKEFLTILLLNGQPAAQQFLDEKERQGGWFAALPFEMRLAVLRFLPFEFHGRSIPIEYAEVIGACLQCCQDENENFAKCLEDGKAKIQTVS
jgi:hypothetical protein